MPIKKEKEHGWLEAKQSGGAVYEIGVKESKRAKALRLITKPLTDKHWKDSGQSVTTLHRINKIAEYLYNRSKREKKDKSVNEASIGSFFNSCLSAEEQRKRKKDV